MHRLTKLPEDLPIPKDDGACHHLLGEVIPAIALASTQGIKIDVSKISGRVVLYIYPMTGQPGVSLPDGWDAIPGARGCTPQSCAFRDHYQELNGLGAQVFGLSTQRPEDQIEAKSRLHLPFELLSDCDLTFAHSLKLPMFAVEEKSLIKRITLILQDGKIIKVFYPVFPPDSNADEVMNWLRNHPIGTFTRM